MAAGDARQASINAQKKTKKPTPPAPVGGVFTPSGFVPNAPVMPPDQAPYRPRQSPAQKRVVRVRRQVTPAFAPRDNGADILHAEQQHARVLAVQRHLNELGWHVAMDGILGDQTRQAMVLSKNGTVRNILHAPEHARRAAAQQVSREHGVPVLHENPESAQNPLGTPTVDFVTPQRPVATASKQIKPSTQHRIVPHYESEPVAGQQGQLRNPDGSWVMPGTRPQPGARPSLRPYYTDEYTHEQTTPSDYDQLTPEQKKIYNANHPLGQRIIGDVANLIPGVPTLAEAAQTGHVSAGTAFGDVANGALWLTGAGELGAAARAARAGDDVIGAFRAARVASKSAAEDKIIARNMEHSASRQQYAKTLKDAGMSRKAQKALIERHDKVAAAYAEAHGVTPEQAWNRIYAHSQYNDVNVTRGDLETGRVVFAQEGKQPEIANVADTPATHLAPPDKNFIPKAAKNLVRRHPKTAMPEEFNTPKKVEGLLNDLRERALQASDYKNWYANSANAILHYTQGDVAEADKLAALIAVYSPRAEVYSFKSEWNNLDRAINAYHDFIENGGEISPKWSISSHKTGEADWQTYRATQIMQGNFEWDGLKTNRFYRNFLQHIDPEKYAALWGDEKFGTMDTWMRRAFKYPKTYKTETEETLLGTTERQVGKAQEPISNPMYRFMEQANKIVADSLGWSPEEAQAAIWTSIKAETEGTPLERAGFDFSHGFEHREARAAAPLKPEQLALETTTADKPLVSDVDAAIEASRQPDSGFTLTANLRPDTPLRGTGRFIVAYGAHEARDAAPLTRQALIDFRNAHLDALRSDPTLRIGGWHNPNDGQIYLDLSRTFDTQDEAMQFAREQGQLAIFDRENPDASLPTGLTPEQADPIKASLREDARLQARAGSYDALLTKAHVQLGGKEPKSGVLNETARRDIQKQLDAFMTDHPGPEADFYFDLQWEAQIARNSKDPELLFQADPLVQEIADVQGLKDARSVALDGFRGKDLKGLPKSRASNRVAQKVADDYMQSVGLTYRPPTEYAKVDPERAKRIAQWYDGAVSAPDDPAVRASYEAMIVETKAQYDAITSAGYRFEFYPAEDPYPAGPSAAIDDLRSNQHMYVFPTDEGFGSLSEAEKSHPLLADSGVKWGDKPVTHNDLFRAVHDFFGHFKEGVGFRADGEENAWRSHVAMYSNDARPAMTAETRGQNSWVNYGPHGEENRTAGQAETVYADQKAVIAPAWATTEGAGAATPIKGAVQRLTSGEHILHLFKGADISTAVHEFGHALETMIPAASREALRKAGIETEEQFARSFERYFYEGASPSADAQEAMRDIAVEMSRVYRRAEDIPDAVVNPEIKRQFDRFFIREAKRDVEFAANQGASWFAQGLSDNKPPKPAARDFPSNNADLEKIAAQQQPMSEDDLARYEAAGYMVDHAGQSVKEAARMFGLEPKALQEHIDSGAQRVADARIHSNADVGAGPAETQRSANDILGNWHPQEGNQPPPKDFFGEEQPFTDETLARTHEPSAVPPPWTRGEPNEPPPTPEEIIRRGLRGAKSQFGKQKVDRSEELRRRAEKVDEALRSIEDPDEAMAAAKGHMRGPLPKIDFHGFTEINETSLRYLKQFVNKHEGLLSFQKVRLNEALNQSVRDGRIPSPAEVRLMEHVFGKVTATGLVEHAHSWGDILINIANIPRTLMATADVSAGLRQGLVVAASHPFLWGRAWPTMLKAMKSGDFYEVASQAVKEDPWYNHALAARVSFTDVGENSALIAHEESFNSDYAANMLDAIPGVPNVIKGSARAYTAFLNKIRMDLFAQQMRIATAAGRDVNDEQFLKSIGDIVNAATGRGTIHGRLEHFLPAMNTLMFSPRLMLSRLNYLDPTWYYRLGRGLPPGAAKQVRLEALRGLFATASAVSSAVYLFSRIPGVEVEVDPRSADFGKIKFGDTRIDVAGGFQQYVRLAAELATNAKISTTTGEKETLGSGFGIPTRADEIQNFLWNKAAPPVAIAHNLVRGTDATGKEFNLTTEQGAMNVVQSNFAPLVLQDAKDLYNDRKGGMDGITAALGGYGLSSIGVGVQTYKAKNPADKPTQKLQSEAKTAGITVPKDVLIALDHKAHLDQLSHAHQGDPQGRLFAVIKYYAQTTGDHQYDHLIGMEGITDTAAEDGIKNFRNALIGTGLTQYEENVKKAAEAKGH